MSFDLGLYTEGLVTCIGVVVTGDPPANQFRDTRFMAHLAGSSWMMESQWTAFSSSVEQAALTNKRGWISLPDTSNMDPALKTNTEEAINLIWGKLSTLINGTPQHAYHPINMPQTLPDGSMQVDKQNQVSMGGVAFP